MNKFSMSLPSSVAAATSIDRDLEHHPLDRRAAPDRRSVSASVPGTGAVAASMQAHGPDLPMPDMRLMVTLLNDAMCQVSLLRNEVDDLRRKLDDKTEDDVSLPVERSIGTIHVSVRTGSPNAEDGLAKPAPRRTDSSDGDTAFDWDAWQRDTKERIRRAMTYQTLSAGTLTAGAE
ncbi:MAG TPA: hypothetical protein VKZ43_02360 [Trueperaceae bacterium]|nr:hypothetical protein [Trueperaceae bacterium]